MEQLWVAVAEVVWQTPAMRNVILLFLAFLCGCSTLRPPDPAATAKADAEFNQLADEFLTGYLAWRPGLGVALGLHEYDGRITDYSGASLSLEHARLRGFEVRLANFPAKHLSARASHGFRLLRSTVRKQLFRFDDLRSFTHNPMTYAGAMDVNIYVKRDFAPLEERVRSIIAILEQAPATFAAAKANLVESLPKPFIETAIDRKSVV